MWRLSDRIRHSWAAGAVAWKTGPSSDALSIDSSSGGVPEGPTAELCSHLTLALSALDKSRQLGRKPDEAIVLFEELSEDARDVAPAFSEAVRSLLAALDESLTPSESQGPFLRVRYWRAALELSCFQAGHSIVGRN